MNASPDPSNPPASLQDAVNDLSNAARTPAKQRGVKISRTVDAVSSKAYEDGLPADLLDILVELITTRNELDQASIATIIRNLYPTTRVSGDIVVKVVGSLGHGKAKAAFPTQAALLKWLVMVYDVLENPRILSQLYSVLFNLLDTIAIRAPLCHLLSLTTRRKHVRPFRIQMLLELARRIGNEPPLVGLIRVYKDYYPDVIVGEAASGRASVFTYPNLEWRKRLIVIQEIHAQRIQEGLPNRHQAFRVFRKSINGVKTSKVSAVPEVHTSNAQESSITLEEFESLDDFVEKFEKVQLPNQLVSVIGDPLLQHLLQLKSSDTILRRIDNWLNAFFEDQLEGGASSGTALMDMLGSMRDYARFTKTVPPACSRFLRLLLIDWNGVEGRDAILELLTYIPIAPFEELYQSAFQNLEYAILDDTPDAQIALLTFYTALLRQWIVALLSSPPPPIASVAISALTTHANKLTLTLLQNSPDVMTHESILTFYETTAFLISQPALQSHVRITTPPSDLIYTLNFSTSLSTLSRLCAILAIYKRAFEFAMFKSTTPTADPNAQVESYPKDYVNLFNGFLMDICNCLWRSKAFNTSDPNALGCLLPTPLLPLLTSYVGRLNTGLVLQSLFSLSYSPVLCNMSISYVRELEDQAAEADNAGPPKVTGVGDGDVTMTDGAEATAGGAIHVRHAGPVTQKSLAQLSKDGGLKLPWPTYRLGVLRYLEGKGVVGVGELMYNTLKHLMTSREAAAKSA